MKYFDGIEVREGDIILIQHQKVNVLGLVVKIIKPNSEDAYNWSAPEGGIQLNLYKTVAQFYIDLTVCVCWTRIRESI
jgi:hypothetical protein